MWKHRGQQRPAFAEQPGPGQESVWDYPRPPVLAPEKREVEVLQQEQRLAFTRHAVRILETASPPTVYLPPDAIDMSRLQRVPGQSFCEWKGAAQYWGLRDNPRAPPIGWSYPAPTTAFAGIRNWLSFYPGRITCLLGGERVQAQDGGFYGGWVTHDIVGPWKGASGTGGW